MKLDMKSPVQIYSSVVIAALLILTAWGNAMAMLLFSAIAAAVWMVVPGIRGQASFGRSLLAGAIGVAIAVGLLLTLHRNQ